MPKADMTAAEFKKRKRGSDLEEHLAGQIRMRGLPTPEREYRFHPVRRWRFDFAWPNLMVAVEVEGGIYAHGRHTRGAGFAADCVKYNEALMAGWQVLRVTSEEIKSGKVIEYLDKLLVEEEDV